MEDLFIFFILGFVGLCCTWFLHLFHFDKKPLNRVNAGVLLLGLGLFFASIILGRLLASVPPFFYSELISKYPSYIPWSQVGITLFSTTVLIYFSLLMKRQGIDIWVSSRFYYFGIGASTWLFIFPIVLFVGHIAMFSVGMYYPEVFEIEQLPVQSLKDQVNNPALFWALGALVVIAVPVVEEILFRGLLHSWIRSWLGPLAAVVITAVLFSLAHYADIQSVGNVPFLVSIFTLAIFQSALYERFRSLWAPIGLHSTYNFATLMFIHYGIA